MFGKLKEQLKELFSFTAVTRSLLGIPLLFLLAYYLLQINYQLDMDIMCLGSKSKLNASESCRSWTKKMFKENSSSYDMVTKLITFILGFYVTNIINRWWTKLRKIPWAENPGMVLFGLTSEDLDAKTEELTSATAVEEAKKMVARYCLLSWAMCFHTFSHSLSSTCGTVEKMEERGLITKEEIAALNVSKEYQRYRNDE